MGDVGDMYRDWKDHKRETRRRLGMPCPVCTKALPKATPPTLLPGQRCRVCGYVDVRLRSQASSSAAPQDAPKTCRDQSACERDVLKAEVAKWKKLFKECFDHLEWCGWGDAWERECGDDLRKKCLATIDAAKEDMK